LLAELFIRVLTRSMEFKYPLALGKQRLHLVLNTRSLVLAVAQHLVPLVADDTSEQFLKLWLGRHAFQKADEE